MSYRAMRGWANRKSLMGLCAIAWLGCFCYAQGGPGSGLKFWMVIAVGIAMVAFLLLHGLRQFGAIKLAVFLTIVVAAGWSLEWIAIRTGIFGRYRYSDSMSPFLAGVPIAVLAAYCVMGYLSWSMARIFLRASTATSTRDLLAAPVLAACLMVVWDLSMDPLRASVEGHWTWLDSGTHYGIPARNYIGWALTTWIMFQAVAVCARFLATPLPLAKRSAGFFACAPLMYLAPAMEYLANPFASAAAADVVVNGAVISVDEIYRDIALLASTTMVPLALAALAILARLSGTRVDASAVVSRR